MVITRRTGRKLFLGMAALTCATHTVLGWKIWRRKRKLLLQQQQQQRQPSVFFLGGQQQHLPSKSRVNLAVDPALLNYLTCAAFVLLVFLLTPALTRLVACSGWISLLGTRVALWSAILGLVPASVYARKPHLRATLAREVRNLLR